MTISLAEELMMPTAMLYRNLMAIDVEEMVRAHPLDGVVLLCGCDKTTPAQLMGIASMDVPAMVVPGGPMLNGRWRNQTLGSGTDVWKTWDERRAGQVSDEKWEELEGSISRSAGHCMTMGTASTMTSLAEALGMTLSGAASIPAVDSRRYANAEASGRRIVELIKEDIRPSHVMTPPAFENAIRVLAALGGSTNAVIHLIAIAGRLGISLPLSKFDELARTTPMIANIQPNGQFLMEEFYYAGGVPAVIKELLPLLYGNELTVTGKTHAQNVQDVECFNTDVIRPRSRPVCEGSYLAALQGNLAPNGAVIKLSAASRHLLQHIGRAVVFEHYEEMLQQIDKPDLDVDENCVLVLKNGGPVGGPGMPEWGQIPIPSKLLKRGVRDMVRLSDSRMSGTSFGTVVLHVSPEAAVGGPLGVVKNGDTIQLDVEKRRLNLLVSEEELRQRMQTNRPQPKKYRRGYYSMFLERILQADRGCDFDFLVGEPGEVPYEPLVGRS
jgi:dihydroxy-acid dehydratase